MLLSIIIFILVAGALYQVFLWLDARRQAAGNFFTEGHRRWLLLGAIVISLILVIVLNCYKDEETNTGEQRSSTCYESRRDYSPRLFKFNGYGFAVKLKSGWKAYPKGGSVKEVMPSGKIFIDIPGVDKNLGNTGDGIYEFYPNSDSTTGVEIWNYW